MIFEDEFTNVQADYVSLCLELVNNNVDKIYIFLYQDITVQTFNAFFKKDGAIRIPTDFGSDELIDEFLEIGIEDINKLIEVCDKYKQKCPNEIKIVYNVQTTAFEAKYGYQDYAKTGEKDPNEVFLEWVKKEK